MGDYKIETFELCIKMDENIIKFDEIKVKKHKFHQHKNPTLIYDVDSNKILISNKVSVGKNGF